MRAVLDTTVLLAADVPPLEGELAISAATLAELHFGVLVAQSGVLAATSASTGRARKRALNAVRRRSSGEPPGRQPRRRVLDLLIAATAHAHGARLYTRNAGGLVGLGELVEIVAV